MGFYGVVVVDKSDKAGVAMLTAAEALLVVPHLHDGADDSLGFAVGLRAIDTREFLSDTIGLAGLNKLMIVCPSVFLTIV